MGRIALKLFESIPLSKNGNKRRSIFVTRNLNPYFKEKFRGKVPKEFNAYQFLGAVKQSIDSSSFHAIPWVTQDVHWLTKVTFYFWISKIEIVTIGDHFKFTRLFVLRTS